MGKFKEDRIMDTGGPAFPRRMNKDHSTEGMTLRDYFAGQAMHEILIQGGWGTYDKLASEAYEVADAMIKERNK